MKSGGELTISKVKDHTNSFKIFTMVFAKTEKIAAL